MTISNVPTAEDFRLSSNKSGKRFRLVILLSTFLIVLGTITLTTSAFWENTSSYAATKVSTTKHAVKRQQMRKPKHTSSPTSKSVHAPTLGYPLLNGNTHIPEVALTFDDGPNPYYTSQVLSILRRYGINATFFDVGYLVSDYPYLVRQEYEEGNTVANHSWSHPQMTSLSAQAIMSQLTSTSKAIKDAIGVSPTFFRPPYGSINSIVLSKARYLGFTTVLWDGSAEDWELPGVNFIVNKILYYSQNGAILLLHDGGGNRAQTVAALPTIIAKLKNRGYKFVTIQQLVDDLVMPLAQNTNSKTPQTTTNLLNPTAVFIFWRRERIFLIF
jgi:peptidoglycan/xylan/chitin deacetylase (PgdA/CDA1 family)